MRDSVIKMNSESTAAPSADVKSSQYFGTVLGFCATGLVLSIAILSTSAQAAQSFSAVGQMLVG